jgi:hypothetical protein
VWRLGTDDVIRLRDQDEGRAFTEFVDRILEAEAYACGIPIASLKTNQRVVIPDGGVDTQVDNAAAQDPVGWMGHPTIWQYKAIAAGGLSEAQLRKEVNKHRAAELILAGHAYRLAVCRSLSNSSRANAQKALNKVVREISPHAPLPAILDANDLARWGSRFPALSARYVNKDLLAGSLHFDAWRDQMRSITRKYVPVDEWRAASDALAAHADLGRDVPDAVMTISGEPGVGKTRMVFETLEQSPASRGLVLYTDDEDAALRFARFLANDCTKRAVLVADECSASAQDQLATLLKPFKSRVRVVAISNSLESAPWKSPMRTLSRIAQPLVLEILAQNYPHVPDARRTAYARLSGGFIRFAADLCANDAVVVASGAFDPTLEGVWRYLQRRLSDAGLVALEAVAMVSRVGRKGDASIELEDLCRHLRLDAAVLDQSIKRLHDEGFIQIAGCYCYVTPAIVADAAFVVGWKTWAEEDPEAFVTAIPPELLPRFMKRVAESGGEEVRRSVGELYLRWGACLTASDLQDLDLVLRLVRLVETDPVSYVPLLHRLVCAASLDGLQAVAGEQVGGRWGPRRQLVWLLEWLAAYKKHFPAAEEMLLRLALAESEPNIGNNATETWARLYQIYLSGTEVPFLSRLKLLQRRHDEGGDDLRTLTWKALDGALQDSVWGSMQPEVRAGRLVPRSWEPTPAEAPGCWRAATSTLERWSQSRAPGDAEEAMGLALRRLASLLGSGSLDSLKVVFREDVLTAPARAEILRHLEVFVSPPQGHAPSFTEEYLGQVRAWMRSLTPGDLKGRLRTEMARSPWEYLGSGPHFRPRREVSDIAGALLAELPALETELEWLHGPEAASAGILGEELGRLDVEASLLPRLQAAAIEFANPLLLRGYIKSLLDKGILGLASLEGIVDTLTAADARLAFELFRFLPAEEAARRTTALFDQGKLGPNYLAALVFVLPETTLPNREAAEVARRLVDAVSDNPDEAARSAFQFVDAQVHGTNGGLLPTAKENDDLLAQAWRLLELVQDDTPYDAQWHFGQILDALLEVDVARAARCASAVLISSKRAVMDEATAVLKRAFALDPDAAMKALGDAILSPLNLAFVPGTHKGLIASIPVETLKSWLESHGAEAAARIARQLPNPDFDAEGKPFVPEITAFVLERFEDENDVFDEFCAGTHHLQLYMGDIAALKRAEAGPARAFLNHPLRRVREWAAREIESSKHEGDWWQRISEEEDLD